MLPWLIRLQKLLAASIPVSVPALSAFSKLWSLPMIVLMVSLLMLVEVCGWAAEEGRCWVWVGADVWWGGWVEDLVVFVGGVAVGGRCWVWVKADVCWSWRWS